MPDSQPAISYPASSALETPDLHRGSFAHSPGAAPPTLHHGSASVPDSNSTPTATLPPTLTPATTTRQSVSLGVLSTIWPSGTTPTTSPPPDPSIPAIITHAPSPDAQEPPSDLTISTGSVPSTTTTLTNTLPPTQSAALRALNAPAFQSHASSPSKSKSAKSTSSRTTLSSQPVVVRTYSGSRHNSRPSSGFNSPRLYPSMNGHASQNPSALSAGLAGRTERLPSVDDFSFSAILRAVDPEIRDAIDAIAEICARSRMSLADEYDAHLPPQGEITGAGPSWAVGMGSLVGRGRISRIGQGWSAAENTLTAVPEASSSSERLAGDGRGSVTAGSSKKRSQSAYGSLKSVISGGSGKKRKASEDSSKSPDQVNTPQEDDHRHQGPAWAVNTPSSSTKHPSITLVSTPQASKQLSHDLSSTIRDLLESSEERPQTSAESSEPKQSLHRRHTSVTSMPHPRTRSGPLSSLASWIPWTRPPDLDQKTSQDLTKAEARLREMLIISQSSHIGKGKASVSVAS